MDVHTCMCAYRVQWCVELDSCLLALLLLHFHALSTAFFTLSLFLSLLLAELTQQELDVIPVTQSTYMQKNKLKFLLGKVDQLLGITPEQRKWSIKGKKISNIQCIFGSILKFSQEYIFH